MDNQAADIREKVRQQFETGPYPRTPLEKSPKNDYDFLFIHNLVTPYYLRNQKVKEPEGKLILDAGCGSGYKTLVLAEANPKAKIIGIDFSAESVKLARQRLEYHGYENAEFYTLSIEDLPSLGMEFDYINNDEVLYLLPDPAAGLRAMKSVLKPDGIIRTNLHSALQRANYYQVQELFKMMNLMEQAPGPMEIELARETIKALKDQTFLKATVWKPEFDTDDERVLANYLLQGDKGFTIPEMFAALKAADLEFVSMVHWWKWDLMDLFKQPDNLPAFLAISLPNLSTEERLRMFELLQPVYRLFDFWCAHPNAAQSFVPVGEWTASDWQEVRVYLHPQLRTPQVKEYLIDSIQNQQPWQVNRYLTTATQGPFFVDSSIAACLLPLWQEAQPIPALVQRWLEIRSVDPVTLEPVSEQTAFEQVKEFLKTLEAFFYVLLERSA